MCGVTGILNLREGPPIDPASVHAALHALRLRGPDGEAVWLDTQGHVALGHRRLAIVDLEGGAQPLHNADNTLHAVVNGEFYDAETQRAELTAQGHTFRTGSDSELALHLYKEYGLDFLQHLRGEFALILWDQPQRRLIAARDRFGIKPLVYAHHAGRLHIASQAKALFAAGVPAAWDHDSFFHAASLQYTPANKTLFADVTPLRPGHVLVAEGGEVKTQAYWDMDYPQQVDDAPYDEAACTEAVYQHLDEAVRLRLRADLPVACHLSGGLDSAAVAALAAQHRTTPLPCFTVSFAHAAYNEAPQAEQIVQHLGAQWHRVDVSQQDLVQHFGAAVTSAEGLAINGHLTAKYLLSRAIRDAGFKVALTGEGADEVFAGYAHLRHDLLNADGDANKDAAIAALHASNAASAGLMLPSGAGLSLRGVEQRLGYTPNFLAAKAGIGHRMHALLAPAFARRFAQRDCFAQSIDSFDVAGQLRGRHPVLQSAYLWTKLALGTYMLPTLGDGTEMAHSVEGRLPFLDHRLFALLRRVPLRLKIRHGQEKYILRRALRAHLPESVLTRQKHPFLAPALTASMPYVRDNVRQPGL